MHGGSMIVHPYGEVLAGPVYDEEVDLYADIDLSMIQQTNLDNDVYGQYSRPDVFNLQVDTAPKSAVEFLNSN